MGLGLIYALGGQEAMGLIGVMFALYALFLIRATRP